MGPKKKVLLFSIGAAMGVATLSFSYNSWLKSKQPDAVAEHAIADIKEGELSYTNKCGWVDWGHASGTGPKNLVDHVLAEHPSPLTDIEKQQVEEYLLTHNLSAKDYFPVTYSQQMQRKVGIKFTAGTKSVYLVKRGLPKKIREGMAWRIFKEVSEHFETLQGSPPYNSVSRVAASSYGIGDLNGDKLAFYSALRGYTKSELEEKCGGSFSPKESLKMLEQQKNNPPARDKWRKMPQLVTVPYIKRGMVLTVVKDGSYQSLDIKD